jgi:hypothetical protein
MGMKSRKVSRKFARDLCANSLPRSISTCEHSGAMRRGGDDDEDDDDEADVAGVAVDD